MKHLLKTSAAVSSIAAPFSHAIITSYTVDLDPIDLSNSDNKVYIDFSTGGASLSEGPNYDISIGSIFTNSEKPTASILNDDYAVAITGSYATRFSFGDALNFDSTFDTSAQLEASDSGVWEGDTGGQIGYLGFNNTTTSMEAWVAIDYDDTANTIDVLSFGVASASDNMTAGQAVPEPSETAALMILAAGSAALYRRRKRR